jgi:hypothetical protein
MRIQYFVCAKQFSPEGVKYKVTIQKHLPFLPRTQLIWNPGGSIAPGIFNFWSDYGKLYMQGLGHEISKCLTEIERYSPK